MRTSRKVVETQYVAAQIICNNEGSTCTWRLKICAFNVQNNHLFCTHPVSRRKKKEKKVENCRGENTSFNLQWYFTNAVFKTMTRNNRNIYLHMAFKNISAMRLIVLRTDNTCRFKFFCKNTPGIRSKLLAVISELGIVTGESTDVSPMINIV